eukprot:TRINITY_DN10169_c0_g1_i2.p1 TRINITY_DN10169_c0_g1~~TRINITY_DN10169_c0_g1_i2.p1  ORF type:complete len:529 (+),score=177.38 TRINITY_DN10169_c0_g1_i2:85-1671(+)
MEVTVQSTVSGESAVVSVPEAGDVPSLRRAAASALDLCEDLCVLRISSGDNEKLTAESFFGLSDGDTVLVGLTDASEAKLDLAQRGFDTDKLGTNDVSNAVKSGDAQLLRHLVLAGAPVCEYCLKNIFEADRPEFLRIVLDSNLPISESILCRAISSAKDECYRMVLERTTDTLDVCRVVQTIIWHRGFPFERLRALLETRGVTDSCQRVMEEFFSFFVWSKEAIVYMLEKATIPRVRLLSAAHESVRKRSPEALEFLLGKLTPAETDTFVTAHPCPLEEAVARRCTRSVRLLLDAGCGRRLCLDRKKGRLDTLKEVPCETLDLRTTPGRVMSSLFMNLPAMNVCAPMVLECPELQPYIGLHVASARRSRTLLHCVARKGDSDATRLLLRHGVDADAVDEKGRTALLYAAYHGHAEVVQDLLSGQGRARATIGKACDNGTFPLLEAARRGHCDVVARLLESGADPNAATPTGTTPLHCAAFCGHAQAVLSLLSAGARPNVQNHKGSPLSAAQAKGHLAVVGMLQNARP